MRSGQFKYMPERNIYLECDEGDCYLAQNVSLEWNSGFIFLSVNNYCEAVQVLIAHHLEYEINRGHGTAKMWTEKNGEKIGSLVVHRLDSGKHISSWNLTGFGEKILKQAR